MWLFGFVFQILGRREFEGILRGAKFPYKREGPTVGWLLVSGYMLGEDDCFADDEDADYVMFDVMIGIDAYAFDCIGPLEIDLDAIYADDGC